MAKGSSHGATFGAILTQMAALEPRPILDIRPISAEPVGNWDINGDVLIVLDELKRPVKLVALAALPRVKLAYAPVMALASVQPASVSEEVAKLIAAATQAKPAGGAAETTNSD